MTDARQENARMLASALGLDEDEASERLARTILVTCARDPVSIRWRAEIVSLLERTLDVTDDPAADACMEIVIGQAEPRTELRRLHMAIDASKATIDLEPVSASQVEPHPLFAAIAASPAVGAVLRMAIDAPGLPDTTLPVTIRFDQLGILPEALSGTLDLDGAVLIGAGAVGNAFLRALRHVDARGRLPIVDPKRVGGGNPNRCLYLTVEDVGDDKATALARNAQVDLAAVRLEAFVEDFHDYVTHKGVQRTAIVTVDSRRVRRSIQSEVPGQVFDASTTDIRAVVVHSHRQPTDSACLSCIYRHVPDENARERAIADGLGITLAMVKESLISAEAAGKIASLHPQVVPSAIEGMAYDSLFKQLCAEQALRTPEGKQVLAPFAFVSALAGALLVVEMMRSEADLATSNYWQVDPWGEPRGRLRRRKPRATDCEFCSQPHFLAVAANLWEGNPVKRLSHSSRRHSEPAGG